MMRARLNNMKAKIRKQAQEISYIAIRLAQLTNNQELANRIERYCLAIIENIYGQKYINSLENTETLEGVVAYAVNTGQISIDNGEELIKRTAALKDLLIEGQTFTEEKFKFEAKLAMLPSPSKQGKGQKGNEYSKLPYSKKPQGPKAKDRQAKIIELLKEKGKLQLRDIVASFPETSERTIRYDLTHLCDSNQLIREGNGGPANFYMLPSSISKSTLESKDFPEIPFVEENRGENSSEPAKTDLSEVFNPPL